MQPTAEARIFEFCGLAWTRQIAMFIWRSTAPRRETGYHGVFHNAMKVAEGWRTGLPAEDQAAIRTIVVERPLATFWLDLVK